MEDEQALSLSRRDFLKSVVGVAAAAALPSWFTEEARAAEYARIAAVPSPHSLLRNAVRVGKLQAQDAHMHDWGLFVLPHLLSDRELLVTSYLPHDELISGRPFTAEWPDVCSIYIRDLHTQEATHLERVSAAYCHSIESREGRVSVSASHDGNWLLWGARSGTHIISRDEQTYRHWPKTRYGKWMSDSLQWCTWQSEHENGHSYVSALQVYSLDPEAQSVRLPLTYDREVRLQYGHFGNCYVMTRTHLLATTWDSSEWKCGREALSLLHLGYEPGTSARYEPDLPAGYSVLDMAFSPQGDAIAWLLAEKDPLSPHERNMRDASGKLPPNPECEYVLAISDAQGSAFREIGTFRSTLYHPQGYEDPAFYFQGLADYWAVMTWRPHHLQWLPGQSTVSFTYDKTLWLVSTQVTKDTSVPQG